MIDIITISSKGQIVIPKSLREEAGLNKQDKLLVVSDKGRLIMEKISKREIREKMTELLDYFSQEFRKKGITKKDIEKEIRAVRKQNA